jgi:hypothetical protein
MKLMVMPNARIPVITRCYCDDYIELPIDPSFACNWFSDAAARAAQSPLTETARGASPPTRRSSWSESCLLLFRRSGTLFELPQSKLNAT